MFKIVVQAGHVAPRPDFLEDATGTAGEQELVHAIQHELVGLLAADPRFEPLHYHSDLGARGSIRADAAIFLHGDGSSNAQSRGYSFGFPAREVNKRLADLVAAELRAIGHPGHRRPDNYTAGLALYYGYTRVVTGGPEVVVEHGFLTHPGERAWLFAHVRELAEAHYRALCAFFGLDWRVWPDEPDEPVEPKLGTRLPAWRWIWLRWRLGEGEFKSCGPRNRVSRPAVPRRISPRVWAWYVAFLARRKKNGGS